MGSITSAFRFHAGKKFARNEMLKSQKGLTSPPSISSSFETSPPDKLRFEFFQVVGFELSTSVVVLREQWL